MSERTFAARGGPLGLGRFASRRGLPYPAAGRTSRGWRALVWVIPAVAVVMVFVYYPLLLNFKYSVEDSNIFTGEQSFVGLDNYAQMVGDPVFWRSLANNAVYAAFSVVFQVFFALVLAAVIESQVKSGGGAGCSARSTSCRLRCR